MKKLLLLLLFIPFASFSQITLQDILSIEGEQSFKRTMIENGFQEETGKEYADKIISYNKKAGKILIMASSFRRSDSLSAEGVTFLFPENIFGENDTYDSIFDVVKDECTFFEIKKYLGNDMAFYLCPDKTPDPKFVELDKIIKKEFPDISILKDVNLTDLEIGFIRNNSLFIIHFPLYDKSKAAKMIEQFIELKKQADKKN